MKQDIFTASDIAKIARTSRQTVNRWLNNGEMNGYRFTKTGDWRVSRKELINFLKSNNIPLDLLRDEDVIKILIVDDEKHMTSAIVRNFRYEDRFRMEVADSGFSAGIKIENFRPDIIILDIYLGDMDGREFFRYIRQNPELSGLKVIGISGKAASEDVATILKLGFDTFLKKPFKMAKLKETILTLMEE